MRVKRNILIFFPKLTLMLLAMPLNLSGAEGKKVGTVHEVNNSSGELTLAVRGGTVAMSEKLYLRIGGKTVLLIATFPMATMTKTRLLPGYGKYLAEIKKGTPVFAYTKGIEKDRDESVFKKSGSESELAMLCGKDIQSENVKAYLAKLGNDYETHTYSDSNFFYAYKKGGLSISFIVVNSQTILETITLINADYGYGYDTYALELPEKLAFSESRREVEAKIGKPAKINILSSVNGLGAEYPDFGLGIMYQGTAEDMAAKVLTISIRAPGQKKK